MFNIVSREGGSRSGMVASDFVFVGLTCEGFKLSKQTALDCGIISSCPESSGEFAESALHKLSVIDSSSSDFSIPLFCIVVCSVS